MKVLDHSLSALSPDSKVDFISAKTNAGPYFDLYSSEFIALVYETGFTKLDYHNLELLEKHSDAALEWTIQTIVVDGEYNIAHIFTSK